MGNLGEKEAELEKGKDGSQVSDLVDGNVLQYAKEWKKEY